MTPDTNYCCKAGIVADKYGFSEKLDENLGEQWAAKGGPGLRQLARQFNELVIMSALLEGGEPALEGEAEMLYTLLTDDDVAAAERGRARRRLEDHSIDPDELTDDFISYRTIDRHFTNCTGRTRDLSTDPVNPDDVVDRINALKRRLEKVTVKSIEQAEDHTALGVNGSDVDVLVHITVICPKCGDKMSIQELFSQACRCDDATTDGGPSTTNEQSANSEPRTDDVQNSSVPHRTTEGEHNRPSTDGDH